MGLFFRNRWDDISNSLISGELQLVSPWEVYSIGDNRAAGKGDIYSFFSLSVAVFILFTVPGPGQKSGRNGPDRKFFSQPA